MFALLILLFPLLITLAILIRGGERVSRIALVGSIFELILVCNNGFQKFYGDASKLEMNVPWIPGLGINFHIGLDGLSLLLVFLTALLYPFIIRASINPQSPVRNPKSFYALMMLMQFALIGVFMARDAFLFYVFYELALIPIYFICAFWGGERSIPITLKFFIYTLAGSLFMLIAILYLYFKTPTPHTFDITAFYNLSLTATEQAWLFWGFFLAFAIKIPIWPFHTWQPDTYTVSPAAGTMLLAGIMLKMGIYGLMRFVVPIVPEGIAQWGNFAMILCIIGIIYASLIALRQNDLKRLIAYSSIAHVGLMAAGVLTVNASGLQGAAIQMLNHGINVVAMFFMIDLIEQRYGTRNMNELSGIAAQMKRFSWLFVIVMLGSVGLPLTNGFIGEFLLLNGLYQHNAWYAAAAGLTIIFGAAYMLRLYRNVFLGEKSNFNNESGDVKGWETRILVAFSLLIILIGVYPLPWLELTSNSMQELIHYFSQQATAASL
ncbi:MAG: NADH-quinone oxidoreductase subunit M [Chitinophagales bacterium]|nr:NADH-quinone oxidoreductase subunit M [Chitinophagales bacterium]